MIKTAISTGLVICIFYAGWIFAHREISQECQRQGGFYVGAKDYWCFEKPVKKPQSRPENLRQS